MNQSGKTFNGAQIEEFQTALASAYPTVNTVRIMLRTKLDWHLDQIAGGTNLTEILFSLILWAENQGRLEEFAQAAYKANPQNPDLRRFVREHFNQEEAISEQLASLATKGKHLGSLWNVPALTENIVDRPEILGEVRRGLLTATAAKPGILVASAIQGQGGIGKTVLAQLLAHDKPIRKQFYDGIYWLPFGQEPNVLSSLGDIIQTFDPTFKISTVQAASAHLQSLLSDKTALLILDDAWEQEHIKPFLVGGEMCRFLITTRRLYVAEDVNATSFSLDVMTPAQSLELFESYLKRNLDVHERKQALQLAKEVGFLPLGLNLAAARVQRGTTWRDLTTALRQEIARLEALTGGRRLLPNQISLEASLLLSLRSLQSKYDKTEELFAWLGILPDDVMITPPMMATWWKMEEPDAADHLELFWKEALLLSAPPITIGERTYPCYRLHDLFHDMARRLLKSPIPQGLGLSLEKAHQLLLERYQEHSIQRHESNHNWAISVDDGYIHEHLAWHMEKAGQLEQMVSLLQEQTLSGQNAWYEAKERLGQTGGYIQDVRKIWDLVRAQSRSYHELGEPIQTLGLELRFVLILTSLNSLAANLPAILIANLEHLTKPYPANRLQQMRQHPNKRKASWISDLRS